MMSKPISDRPELTELIRKSIAAVDAMMPEQRQALRQAQRISWVYGNLAIDNPSVTREMVEKVVDEMGGPKEEAYRDGFRAAMALLREPSEELADEIAELFDDHYLPAWQECSVKHGRKDVRPAFAAWGPTFFRALAEKIAKVGPK